MGEEESKKVCSDAPVWWHPNGMRMRPLSDLQRHSLQIVSDRATLTISPDKEPHKHRVWVLAFEINRVTAFSLKTQLKIPEKTLCLAFALRDDPDSSDEWLTGHYGADSAIPGYYIRSGDYLNIPGPGTGRDGDSNLSILLDNDIRALLEQLLELP